MRTHFKISLTILLTLVSIALTQDSAAIFLRDEDTIVIDGPGQTEHTGRNLRQFGANFPFNNQGFHQQFPGFPSIQHTPTSPSQLGSCLTRHGENGHCATFRACYPAVYSSEPSAENGDDESQLRNPELAAQLREASGPCETDRMAHFLMFKADAKYREKLVCCPNQSFPPLQDNQITQQQQQPGGTFQQLPIGFPFQQVTMRPPWAVKPTTSTTMATTTTTKAPSTTKKQPAWGNWQQSTTKPTWGWPQSTKKPTWGQWPAQQFTTKRPTWGQWPGTTKQPAWGWPQQQQSSTMAPAVAQWPPPLPTHPPFHPAVGQWPPPLPTSATHRPAAVQVTQATQPPSVAAPAPVSSSCGRVRVVGGSLAQKGEFPWLVSLIKDQKHFCGGTVLDSQYILTAAHCIAHFRAADVQRMRVLIGDYDLSTTSDGPVTVRKVTKVIRHRGFSHQTLHNDIALLKLDTPIKFGSNGNNNIQPICLASSGGYDNGHSKATVAGWGATHEHGGTVTVYRKVQMRIWTNPECKAKYGHNAPGGIQSHMVCAGATHSDACRGDSGGPLMQNKGGRWEQIGVVSWGIGCGRYPGVYTRVDQFSHWIAKNRRY